MARGIPGRHSQALLRPHCLHRSLHGWPSGLARPRCETRPTLTFHSLPPRGLASAALPPHLRRAGTPRVSPPVKDVRWPPLYAATGFASAALPPQYPLQPHPVLLPRSKHSHLGHQSISTATRSASAALPPQVLVPLVLPGLRVCTVSALRTHPTKPQCEPLVSHTLRSQVCAAQSQLFRTHHYSDSVNHNFTHKSLARQSPPMPKHSLRAQNGLWPLRPKVGAFRSPS